MDSGRATHHTRAYVHLARLTRNMRLLQGLAGERPMWPAIKADAYGHGAELVARHLSALGYDTLCVAHVGEALALLDAGVAARFMTLSAPLPQHAELFVAHDIEPAVCTVAMIDALASAAERAGRSVRVHVKVDTGMGRIGISPADTVAFLEHCRTRPRIEVQGVMSHFARADEADKRSAVSQLEIFRGVMQAAGGFGIRYFHLANSAGIFDVPDARLDAVRPGISIYGLKPSPTMLNPRCSELEPVLELRTRVTFLKEVPQGVGLSYGHAYHTRVPSLIATLPIGYGDGLSRRLSNNLDVLIHGTRCPQVGRITMDQTLIDVTRLRGHVAAGDEVVVIGRQGEQSVTADELAARLGTINYEIVTSLAARVPRIAVS